MSIDTTYALGTIVEALAEIEDATVKSWCYSRAHANIVISPDRAIISVSGADVDEYQEQVNSAALLTVEHYPSSATITIKALDGETLTELVARVLEFVSTETPVPA